jgi:hypothetical protein
LSASGRKGDCPLLTIFVNIRQETSLLEIQTGASPLLKVSVEVYCPDYFWIDYSIFLNGSGTHQTLMFKKDQRG